MNNDVNDINWNQYNECHIEQFNYGIHIPIYI